MAFKYQKIKAGKKVNFQSREEISTGNLRESVIFVGKWDTNLLIAIRRRRRPTTKGEKLNILNPFFLNAKTVVNLDISILIVLSWKKSRKKKMLSKLWKKKLCLLELIWSGLK